MSRRFRTGRYLTAAMITGLAFAGCVPSPPATAPTASPESPVAHFPLDGDARSADGRFVGQAMNGVTFAPGKVGQAAVFPAAQDPPPQIVIPKDPAFSLSAPMTLAAWVKPANEVGQGSYLPVITKGRNKEDYTLWLTHSGPDLLLNWDTANEFWAHRENAATSLVRPNAWAHLAAVYDGAAVTFYLNGKRQASSPFNKALDRSNEDLYIGASPPGSLETFQGLIDEVQIYAKALDDGAVLRLAGN